MLSVLQEQRQSYLPKTPEILADLQGASFRDISVDASISASMKSLFPHTHNFKAHILEKKPGLPKARLSAGVLFSGGPAPGGHNVIAGLWDALKEIDPKSRLIGFIDGPCGLVENRHKNLTKDLVDLYRNQGGFDLIGSVRSKIEDKKGCSSLEAIARTVKENNLDAIVIIGGDGSNTLAAVLAEYFLEHRVGCRVIGVPKTIDGDLRSEDIEISFGFDTACKIYSELIGNIGKDALSAKRYYHFIRLMGRTASHIALECALACQPNLALIGEEKQTLESIVHSIVNLVIRRKEEGKDYGVILIPEGLIEFLPEFNLLISAINRLLAKNMNPYEAVAHLDPEASAIFSSLPKRFQEQLLLERDPNGNVHVSQIETEQLILDLVKTELKKKGFGFNPLHHFFGYEGRSAAPSNFDANYCYSLGRLAALAVKERLTGVTLAIKHLKKSVEHWQPKAIPIVQLMHLETRLNEEKPVIRKALVDLNGKAFRHFALERKKWALEDSYRSNGPIQFFGSSELTDSIPVSLSLS